MFSVLHYINLFSFDYYKVNFYCFKWRQEELCGWKRGDGNHPGREGCKDYFRTVVNVDQASQVGSVQSPDLTQIGPSATDAYHHVASLDAVTGKDLDEPLDSGSIGSLRSFGSRSTFSSLYERDRIRSPGSL